MPALLLEPSPLVVISCTGKRAVFDHGRFEIIRKGGKMNELEMSF